MEVAGVVGVNADNLRQQIARHDEKMIFESSLTLRKPDLVPAQELPAEQLVWRQAVHDRRVADTCTRRMVSCEDDARNTTLQPSHLRQHDVGSAAGREVIQPLEGLRAQPVVMIAEEHVLATEPPRGRRCAAARPARVRLVDDAECCGYVAASSSRTRWRVVGGTIVDADDSRTHRGGRLWEISESMHGPKYSPGLYTGTTTLTLSMRSRTCTFDRFARQAHSARDRLSALRRCSRAQLSNPTSDLGSGAITRIASPLC